MHGPDTWAIDFFLVASGIGLVLIGLAFCRVDK